MLPLGTMVNTGNGPGIHIAHDEVAVGNIGTWDVWLVAGGPILVLALWGEIVTTLMDGTAAELAFQHSQGNEPLCAASASVANDPVGTFYWMTGIAATPLEKTLPTVGVPPTVGAPLTPIPCTAGNLHCVVTTGNQTGTVQWHLVYQPLETASVVTNAAYV